LRLAGPQEIDTLKTPLPSWSTRARHTGNTVTNMASVTKEATGWLCFAGKVFLLLDTLHRKKV